MKSSSGEHYLALDHVRALAVFLVFSWHFLHGAMFGFPVAFGYAPVVFPLALVSEGHTGVALFMTLSGYLFAKLLDGKRVNYPAFFWNRALRLFPLLFVVIIACGVQTWVTNPGKLMVYVAMVEQGWYKPTLPNGAWSIVIELHFYILLPILLFLARKSRLALPAILLAAIALRAVIHHQRGEVETLAYLTLVGRIDQFLLGILAFQYRRTIANRHVVFWLAMTAFTLFYWYFARQGGFLKFPIYPSPSPIWIFLPTLEGLAYGLLIAYYDSSFSPANTGLSKIIGQIGAYSYSIYLLHFFLVFRMMPFIVEHIMAVSNFYAAFLWSLPCFALMLPIGYLSFRFVESPFLKFRRRYLVAAPTHVANAVAG